MIASSCNLFPESTDVADLLGHGISSILVARRASFIDERVDSVREIGTRHDTLEISESDEELLLGSR